MPQEGGVDDKLRAWRQGDFSRDHQLFPYADIDDGDHDGRSIYYQDGEDGILGAVIVSQTCDIVRSSEDRPFVEVCALVQLDAADYAMASKGNRPRYAVIPSGADALLAADLDRVAIVSKALVAGWRREAGCRSDAERVGFAQKLERKRGRFAFPSDFSEGMKKFLGHLYEKHSKEGSEAGKAYNGIAEIRVRSAPAWPNDDDGEEAELTFFFILQDGVDRTSIIPWIEKLWGKLHLPPRYKLSDPPFHLLTYDDMLASHYRESQPLDVEALSLG